MTLSFPQGCCDAVESLQGMQISFSSTKWEVADSPDRWQAHTPAILPGQDQRIGDLGHINRSKNIIRSKKPEMAYMAICFRVRSHADMVIVRSLTVDTAVFRMIGYEPMDRLKAGEKTMIGQTSL